MKAILTILILAISLISFGQKTSNTYGYPTYHYGGLKIGKTTNAVVIDSAVVLNSKIYFYKDGTNLNPDYVPVPVVEDDTIAFKSLDFEAVRFLNELGDSVKMLPLSMELGGSVLTPAMGAGNIYYNMFLVKKVTTIKSFHYVLSAKGDYTVDTTAEYNGIAIMYPSNDTLFKIAETVNNSTVWKSEAGARKTVFLPSPVTLTPGIYFIVCLYNNATQATAPSMQGIGATTFYNYILPNSMKLAGYSSTSTNATIPAFVKQSAIYPTSSSYVIIGK